MFRGYLHVEQIWEPIGAKLLNNDKVYITPKIDGTNACVWYDPTDDTIHTGSRTREITPDNDNAGLAQWMAANTSDEAQALTAYLKAHPQHIIYGEWMGSTFRFIGNIKDYTQAAHTHLYIFDIFDKDRNDYLPEQTRIDLLEKANLTPWAVPILAVLDHPTPADILAQAENNHFLLSPDVNHPGEGVVFKVDGFRNDSGQPTRGKLVLNEYKQMKRKTKHPSPTGSIERDIVDYYLTDAELAKTREKVVVLCDAERFDTTSAKMVGMFISLSFTDVLSECPNWVKRFKQPTVDFAALKATSNAKVRQYLGLN